ncbi:MAG: hypothetical protein WCX65_01640 [bacterium]
MKIDVTPYLSKLQEASAKLQPEDPIQKNTLKALLTRIKYSRMSRSKREALYRMARDLAVNDKLDAKAAKGIMEIIFISEVTDTSKEGKDTRLGQREKSVDDQVKEVYSFKAERQRMKDQLDDIGNLFSSKA